MKSKEFHFATISKITLTHEPGAPTSTLKSADLRLEVSGNLERSVYLDGRGIPRKEANKPMINSLVMGLITHMRFAAQKGWMTEAEVMQYATNAINKAFTTPGAEPFESTMEY